MLSEYQNGMQRDLDLKDETIRLLYLEIEKFKRGKKEAISLVMTRDVELGRQNKKF